MKKNLILVKKNSQDVIGEFNSIEDAQAYVDYLVQEDKGVSVFSLSVREVECGDVPVAIPNYEAALEYLGRENNACMCGISDKHAKALNALNKLITIAEAWNKADNFVPDFSNRNQYKYFPWFAYKNSTADFGYVATYGAATYAGTDVGSRLCFKDRERVEQFGEQFIDLWNDFLLFH